MQSTLTPPKAKDLVGDPLIGLSLLAQLDKPSYFKTVNDCRNDVSIHRNHPLGLRIPRPGGRDDRSLFRFVGTGSTDMSVEAFVVNVRKYIGYEEFTRVKRLRVITAPFGDRDPNEHYVFFELHVGTEVIISGECTDFSGAGNAARQSYENLFALFSQLYCVPIDRETTRRPVNLEMLYRGD